MIVFFIKIGGCVMSEEVVLSEVELCVNGMSDGLGIIVDEEGILNLYNDFCVK